MSGKSKVKDIDEQVIAAVRHVLRDRLGKVGFEGADIYPGEDHDGDPVLFVEVRYRLTDEPIDAKVTFGLVSALRDALQDLGETRFPHLRHHFDDRQQVAP